MNNILKEVKEIKLLNFFLFSAISKLPNELLTKYAKKPMFIYKKRENSTSFQKALCFVGDEKIRNEIVNFNSEMAYDYDLAHMEAAALNDNFMVSLHIDRHNFINISFVCGNGHCDIMTDYQLKKIKDTENIRNLVSDIQHFTQSCILHLSCGYTKNNYSFVEDENESAFALKTRVKIHYANGLKDHHKNQDRLIDENLMKNLD